MSSENQILLPPSVKTSVNTQLPPNIHTCRVKKAERHKSADPAKAGNESIHVSAEIVAPDLVLDPKTGTQVKAAGRNLDFYIPIVAEMKNYEQAFVYLGALQLLEPNGGFNPDKVIAQMNRGDVFFDALILSGPDFYTIKGPDGKYVDVKGPDGQSIQKGWKITMLKAEQIQARVAAPPGFSAPPY
jgi:hypothetical protein